MAFQPLCLSLRSLGGLKRFRRRRRSRKKEIRRPRRGFVVKAQSPLGQRRSLLGLPSVSIWNLPGRDWLGRDGGRQNERFP